MIRKEELFKIGKFTKPHGVKGEITLLTQYEGLETMDEPYIVCEMDGIFVPFFVESFRIKSNSALLVKFECLDSDEAVRPFVNREAYISLTAIDPEEMGEEMLWEDWLGYRVFDEREGELGTIMAVDTSTVNVLFRIDHKGRELIFPAAEELVHSVNEDEKIIWVKMPEGLLDL